MKTRIAATLAAALVVLTACSAAPPAAPAGPPPLSDQHATSVDRVTWACDGSVLIYTWTGYAYGAGGISAVPGDPRCKA
jgi:hypothetical protein